MRIFAYYHGQGLVCELDKAMLFTYLLQEKDIVELIINHIELNNRSTLVKQIISEKELPDVFYWYWTYSGVGLKERTKKEFLKL